MNIDIGTRMIALFGKPLGFSFAARMQNAAYGAMGLNMLYFYSEVENDHLPDVLNAVRYMNFAGCAVTKPNKVNVLQYLDELDGLCEKMGTCNTVVKLPDGRLEGYNTDGIGFILSLEEETDVALTASSFISLGAGGVGRAICSALAYYGAKKIFVADKIAESARSLVNDINEKFAPVAEFVDFDDTAALYAKAAEADVVMNNTGIGMIPKTDATPLPKEALNSRQLCFDATYNPEKTRFLREAEEVGCRTLSGLGMSVYQGAAQIKLWSGKDAPVALMKAEVRVILAEHHKKEMEAEK
ncbi:MAG: shikimate dehydrogenase [bacterium]|nr:shikimate dehydrogenase [bacterium]